MCDTSSLRNLHKQWALAGSKLVTTDYPLTMLVKYLHCDIYRNSGYWQDQHLIDSAKATTRVKKVLHLKYTNSADLATSCYDKAEANNILASFPTGSYTDATFYGKS